MRKDRPESVPASVAHGIEPEIAILVNVADDGSICDWAGLWKPSGYWEIVWQQRRGSGNHDPIG